MPSFLHIFHYIRHSLSSLKIQDPFLLFILFLLLSAVVADETKPGCQPSCGDLRVPYPFGIGDECFLEGFQITCNDSYTPPKPFLRDFEVLNISLTQNQINIKKSVSHTSWGFNITDDTNNTGRADFTGTPFAFSNTENKFTVTGCNSIDLIRLGDGNGDAEAVSGCLFVCNNNDQQQGNDTEPCSGFGCCQTTIPGGLTSLLTQVVNIFNESGINTALNELGNSARYQCGYAFLVDVKSYVYESSDLDQCSLPRIEKQRNSRETEGWPGTLNFNLCKIETREKFSHFRSFPLQNADIYTVSSSPSTRGLNAASISLTWGLGIWIMKKSLARKLDVFL